MKSYDELTRLGRLRRLRQLAQIALAEYGMEDARLTFMHYQGNVIFRVDVPPSAANEHAGDIFVPNRYNLRILSISDLDTILSELTWLAALRHQAGLPVPEPVPTLDGKLLTQVSITGVPHGRVVSLMRWVDGRQIKKVRPNHAKAWGRLMGQLHRFAAAWKPSEGFKRFQWDWDGLLGQGVIHDPIEELVASMPTQLQEPFKTISARGRELMGSLGTGPDAFGLIHADMYLENVLFKAGDPRAIDFEDCGFGYWLFDIAVALSQWSWTEEYPQMRDTFLDGYLRTHSLPAEQLEHLDLFMAVQYATMVLWSSSFIRNDPARRAEHEKWRHQEGENLLRFLNLMPSV